MKVANKSGGDLVLPGGKGIADGQEVSLTKAEQDNVAVKQWLDAGKLVEVKAKKAASKADK